MNIIYPEKNFLKNFKKLFIQRENIKIEVRGYRKKIIKKQISRWGQSIIDTESVESRKNVPSFLLSMALCMNLMSMHFMAITHGYIMTYYEENDEFFIEYEYLLKY
ncbi:hypothetical protein [Lampropedia aestuarii]|uniref:hypothetical protein n=1 Tax=Lampropedia aestuarii TaxID=2562762 RepID=UPI00246976A8|nr:hypothetical protein [Lampropedia aestuarii]MDH5856532.1 hypothetical protein [Lampropedia aestuarii]